MSDVTRQAFKTTDRLRVLVGVKATQPPGLANRLRNPNGTQGAWGWRASNLVTLGGSPVDEWERKPAHALVATTASLPSTTVPEIRSELYRCTPGTWVGVSMRNREDVAAGQSRSVLIHFQDRDGNQVGGASGMVFAAGTPAGVTQRTNPVEVPAGAYTHNVTIRLMRTTTGERRAVFDQVMLVGDTQSNLGNYAYADPYVWSDHTQDAYEVNIDRQGLNVGALTAYYRRTVRPDAFRPGNLLRALAWTVGDGWQPIFTGEIDGAAIEYDALTHPDPGKRARLTLRAVDAAKRFANTSQPSGPGTISDVRYALEGTGIPYEVNYSTQNAAGTFTPVSVNERASTLDQVSILRDSYMGQAWIDNAGGLIVRDPIYFTVTTMANLGEDDYHGPPPEIGYDTASCINTVVVKRLYVDGTGQTVEEVLPAQVDNHSVEQWGSYSYEFTVQGLTQAQALTLARAILDANSTPAVRVNALTVAIKDDDAFTWDPSDDNPEHRVHLDLYDLVKVTNNNAGIVAMPMRVTSIRHRITANKWMMDLGFEAPQGVALPQQTPALNTSATGAGWQALAHAGSGGTLRYRVHDGVFTLHSNVSFPSKAIGVAFTLVAAGVIPSTCNPSEPVYFPVVGGNAVGFIVINTDGTISFRASTAAMTSASGIVSYPIG